ncbi:PEP/pyruvate-binding domain-containing protein [Lentzea sp. CA-135723]|uniref:PEP/pyruvate-binding domain-containing protein n=1 Tax=Lentzea sp. CA-135723 TaxID=3239950 RepID=UPI003D8D142D
MVWLRHLSASLDESPEVVGGKAHGLVLLHRLGLLVPPAFVVTTSACRAFLHDGVVPDGLLDELASAVESLGTPLVSVRSGAAVSMPGMMDTILNVRADGVAEAVQSVFTSWHTPRARTYRTLHDIPHDLGTAVIVQQMVFGDRDGHSGSGVAFSRNPDTGAAVPFGEVLFGHQGQDVVSGTSLTHPLTALADREPEVWQELQAALGVVEGHYRDACYVEFTYESGTLWLLQVRPGRFAGAAAVRLAVDLVDEGVLTRDEALLRVSPAHLKHVRTPRIALAGQEVLARGLGVCPGVATGRIAVTADAAVRMALDGPVVLVRPETSPDDIRGLAAATGVVTARGGPASHAAVVARSMGKPGVVGVAALEVGEDAVTAGGRRLGVGAVVSIDGTSGDVVLGEAPVVTGEAAGHLTRLLEWADAVVGEAVVETAVVETAVGEAAVAETAAGETAVAETAVGEAAVGEAAVAETAVGEAAVGETAAGEAAVAERAVGETAVGKTAVAETAVGEAAVAQTAVGKTAVGETAVRETAAGEAAVAERAVGETALPGGLGRDEAERLGAAHALLRRT